MDIEKLDWETSYESADNVMIHKISERVYVRTDFRHESSKVIKDGEVKMEISIEGYSVSEYTEYLLNICTETKKLNILN